MIISKQGCLTELDTIQQIGSMNKRKLLKKLLSGSRNIRFYEEVACSEAFGFRLARINGSHHIYSHPGVPELVNLQEGKAKDYQIRQLLELIEIYNLETEDKNERLSHQYILQQK